MSDEEDAVSGGQEGAEARAQGRLSRGGKEAGGPFPEAAGVRLPPTKVCRVPGAHLSRRRLRPHGARSCGRTSRCGGTATPWPHSPRTARCPG